MRALWEDTEIAGSPCSSIQIIENGLPGMFHRVGVTNRLELALFVHCPRVTAHATTATGIEVWPLRPERAGVGCLRGKNSLILFRPAYP
jgi:hypothetical protein